MSKSLKAFLFKAAATTAKLAAIAYICTCGFLFLRQNQLIYTPTSDLRNTPASAKLTHEDVWLAVPNADRDQIHGWWIPASSEEKGVVLYFHGAGHNLSSYLGDLKSLQKMGFSVFAIDYRGYGRSKGGFPSEAQIYQDAQISWNYLTQQRRIASRQIYIFGVSLGGAVAINLAQQHPDAAALVVVSSFTRMRDQIANIGLGMFPIDLILTQKFDSVQKIKSVRMPVLLAHGAADEYIPSWMSQKLFDTASQPKRLLLVPGIDHGRIGALIGGSNFSSAMQQLRNEATN